MKEVIENTNVDDWINTNAKKLSLAQVCEKFGIDVENIPLISKIFLNANLTHKIAVNDHILQLMGISYASLHVHDGDLVLSDVHFESILKRLRTPESANLLTLFTTMKMAVAKFRKYENTYINQFLVRRLNQGKSEKQKRIQRQVLRQHQYNYQQQN